MPDGNLIDKLSVEISASVDPSIKAIDDLQLRLGQLSGSIKHFGDGGKYKAALDNLTSGFEGLNSVISKIDTTNITIVSKAIGKLATNISAFTQAAGNIEQAFTPIKKEQETLTDAVGKELSGALKEVGITGSKDVARVSNEFIKLGEMINTNTGDVPEQFDTITDSIRETGYVLEKATNAYQGFLDSVQSHIRAAKKIHLEKEITTAKRDGQYNYWMGDASYVSKGAGGSSKFTSGPGTTTFQEMAQEIHDETGMLTPFYLDSGGGAHFDWDEFVQTVREARKEQEAFASGGNKVSVSLDEASSIVWRYADNIAALMKNFQENPVSEETVTPIQRLFETLGNLNDVDIPDMSGLNPLSNMANKIGGEKGAAIGDNLSKIFTSLGNLGGNVTIPDFSGLSVLANAVTKLGNDKAQNAAWVLPNIMAELESFSGHFSGLTIDATSLETIKNLGSAFSRLGGKNATEAISTLPQLSDAIRQVVDDLNNLPEVSDKTLQLVTALSQLKASNLQVAKSADSAGSSFNFAGKMLGNFSSRFKSAYNNSNFFATALNKIKEGVNNYNNSMRSAEGHTQSLVAVIVKARTLIWGFKRLFSMFSESINLASNLTEVQNVIDNVFTTNYAAKVEDMSKGVIESLGMSELSFKQYASRYQAMGKAMGITNSQMAAAQKNLAGMGVAYGETNANMQDMSVNLTALAADLASFYDIEQETAYEKLQAIYTGQTRPLNIAA